jgi:branched-chain amino acid transport system substrate-binding protein
MLQRHDPNPHLALAYGGDAQRGVWVCDFAAQPGTRSALASPPDCAPHCVPHCANNLPDERLTVIVEKLARIRPDVSLDDVPCSINLEIKAMLRMAPSRPGAALLAPTLLAVALLAAPQAHAAAATPDIPVLVPVTGFLAAEGSSQRNGALLALQNPPAGVQPRFAVTDTGTSPEGAVNALERALSDGEVTAVVASMLGTQMLAMLPIALAHKVPLTTMSGTADITRKGNPYVFRFFPADSVVKGAQVRYAIETDNIKRPAVIYQTTAYGQSGHTEILKALDAAGIKPVYEDALDVSVKDMQPVLAKARAAGADSLLLQLHGGPTALFLKAAAAMDIRLPIVAGSGLAQPATVALLDPAEIKGVCAETGSSPVSAETPAMQGFLERYRAAFHTDPDGFALGQYDATMMVLDAVAHGATTAADVTVVLANKSYAGLAMTYQSDGHGDMAHSAVIICYDGKSRIPAVVKHYDFSRVAP